MTTDREPRAYIVTQPIWGTRTVIVEARTAAEAVDLAEEGKGEALDTNIHQIGRGYARLDRDH